MVTNATILVAVRNPEIKAFQNDNVCVRMSGVSEHYNVFGVVWMGRG